MLLAPVWVLGIKISSCRACRVLVPQAPKGEKSRWRGGEDFTWPGVRGGLLEVCEMCKGRV